MFALPFILSILPLVIFLLLLLGNKTSLLTAAALALLSTFGATLFYWQILPAYALHSSLKGFLVALDIFIIIFGAVFFLEILQELKVIDNLSYYLESFSKDYRIQVILLAWFLENFLEGTAGFGTPLVIVVPLLISIGLPPLTAVVISLIGNSTAGVFGAVGTPIRVGLAGLGSLAIPRYASLINGVGFLVPIFMIWILAAGQKDGWKHFWEGLPFAFWSGLAFVVPSAISVVLGQEFPSILGAAIGVTLVLLTTRLGLFLPKNVRTLQPAKRPAVTLPLLRVIFPYCLLISLLIMGKLFLQNTITIPLLAGIKHTFNLFNPGFAFILAAIPLIFRWGKPKALVFLKLKLAFRRTLEPFWVIVCVSIMTQLMFNSGHNFSGLSSMLELIAKNFEVPFLPFLAPFVGAFGAFITGSVTLSNIMFGNFLKIASETLKFNSDKILSLGLVGAAAGNMIALADMLSAEAVAGLKNQERSILKGVIIPCLIYVFLAGLVGMFITYSR